MDEIGVDRDAVQRAEARLAVAEDRLRPPVRHPSGAQTRHRTFGDDPRRTLGATAAQRAGHKPLVVTVSSFTRAVGARGVEYGDPRSDRRGDRLLAFARVTRQTHTAQADA